MQVGCAGMEIVELPPALGAMKEENVVVGVEPCDTGKTEVGTLVPERHRKRLELLGVLVEDKERNVAHRRDQLAGISKPGFSESLARSSHELSAIHSLGRESASRSWYHNRKPSPDLAEGPSHVFGPVSHLTVLQWIHVFQPLGNFMLVDDDVALAPRSAVRELFLVSDDAGRKCAAATVSTCKCLRVSQEHRLCGRLIHLFYNAARRLDSFNDIGDA
jgi:hypothetical protein